MILSIITFILLGAFEVAPIAESKSVSIGGLEVQDVLEPPQNCEF